MKPNAGRRTFLATCAMAGAAATRPLAAFGQAVENAPQASSPSALRTEAFPDRMLSLPRNDAVFEVVK